jgi:hypothetical protein
VPEGANEERRQEGGGEHGHEVKNRVIHEQDLTVEYILTVFLQLTAPCNKFVVASFVAAFLGWLGVEGVEGV